MILMKDIFWLAGLLEGEASFEVHYSYPRINLQMTDLDVCVRAAKILGVESVRARKTPPGRKQLYVVRLNGRRAIEWIMTLYTLMGERRQAKFRELISRWKSLDIARNCVPRPHVSSRGSTVVWQKPPVEE
jgi:hypothetical protein